MFCFREGQKAKLPFVLHMYIIDTPFEFFEKSSFSVVVSRALKLRANGEDAQQF